MVKENTVLLYSSDTLNVFLTLFKILSVSSWQDNWLSLSKQSQHYSKFQRKHSRWKYRYLEGSLHEEISEVDDCFSFLTEEIKNWLISPKLWWILNMKTSRKDIVKNKTICERLIYGIHKIKTVLKKLHIHHCTTH